MTRYVDPVAVERVAGGDRLVRVRPIERCAAVQRLTAAGMSTAVIARVVGVTPRTVTRCRGRAAVEVSTFG